MSANDVVIRSGRVVSMGTDQWELRDDGRNAEFVDILTELRYVNSVVYLSLASSIIEAGNPPTASLAARLRMDLGTAQSLHMALGQMIAEMIKPTDPTKRN